MPYSVLFNSPGAPNPDGSFNHSSPEHEWLLEIDAKIDSDTLVVDSDLLVHLASLLNTEFATLAAHSLYLLSGKEAHQTLMIKIPAVLENLARLLQDSSDDSTCAYHAILIFSTLAKTKDYGPTLVQVPEFLAGLIALLQGSDECVRERAASTLKNLTEDVDCCKVIAIAQPVLFDLLSQQIKNTSPPLLITLYNFILTALEPFKSSLTFMPHSARAESPSHPYSSDL